MTEAVSEPVTDAVTESVPEPAGVGLRERHKRSTRRALEDAALRLFARDGFDATTIEAIAAEAEVSSRTFFRYFTAKDEVLDMGWAQRRVRLQEEAARAPAEAGDLAAAAAALVAMARDLEPDHERIRLRARAARSSPALRGRTADTMAAWEAALAEGLGVRRGLARPDPAAVVAAAAALAAWRTAIGWWLEGRGRDGSPGLAEHVEAAFAHLGVTR